MQLLKEHKKEVLRQAADMSHTNVDRRHLLVGVAATPAALPSAAVLGGVNSPQYTGDRDDHLHEDGTARMAAGDVEGNR
jgi:hypothetical protein